MSAINMQNFAYAGQMIKTVFFDFFWQKVIMAFVLNLFMFSFDPKLYSSMEALVALVIADFFIALYVAKRTGVQISSAKVFRSAIKLAVYSVLISSAVYTEKAVGFNLFLDESIIGFLAISNMISILEHTATLGYPTPKNLLNYLIDVKNKE